MESSSPTKGGAEVNSGAPGYTTADRIEANTWRWTLVSKYSDMPIRNIGGIPNDAFYHSKASILLRAARENGGTLAGQMIEVHVDRDICRSCIKVLPRLGLELGSPAVTFANARTGKRTTMRDGYWQRQAGK